MWSSSVGMKSEAVQTHCSTSGAELLTPIRGGSQGADPEGGSLVQSPTVVLVSGPALHCGPGLWVVTERHGGSKQLFPLQGVWT